MEKMPTASQLAREAFIQWEKEIQQNVYTHDDEFRHTIQFSSRFHKNQ